MEFKASNIYSFVNIKFNRPSQKLPFLESVIFLGIEIDAKLIWKTHIQNRSKKLSSI